ncbi:MAG: helix-turn-helix transcriptional regulator [Bacteroidales bacterium]
MDDRIKEIIAYEHLSDGEFADIVGINRSTLSHCLSGRNEVSKDIIIKIHKAYPYISINWLMFGEGDPGFRSSKESSTDLFSSFEQNRTTIDDGAKYCKEIELTDAVKVPNMLENNSIMSHFDTVSEKSEIEIQGKILRKVDKIILYYSDNTFETFERR